MAVLKTSNNIIITYLFVRIIHGIRYITEKKKVWRRQNLFCPPRPLKNKKKLKLICVRINLFNFANRYNITKIG